MKRLGIASLLALALLPTAQASAETVRVRDVARALDRDPVYVAASKRSALSPAAANRLRRKIARLDKGRIQIAVVPDASAERVGGIRPFANAVDQALPNRRGTLIATTGQNFQIVTSHTGVDTTLAAVRRAVEKYHGLKQELSASVEGVAEVDPGPNADVNGPPQSSTPAPVPSSGSNSPSTSGDGPDVGAIVGIVFAAIILVPLLVLGLWLLVRWRRKRRASDQLADLDLGSARDELLALGQDIESLDLDTQMPNANPAGREEYERALMLYDRANRALAFKEPSQVQIYEAKRAAEEGRARVRAARNLLAAPGGETVHPSP